MFGNKAKLSKEELLSLQKSVEQGDHLVDCICGQKDAMEGDFSSMEDSHKQMETYVHQVMENVEQVREYSGQNVDGVASLCRRLDELCEELRHAESDYDRILELLRRSQADSQSAVEQHKHFTTPSKALSEITEELHAQNQGHVENLDRMMELGKQMGVLALNAAIEAGRMGDQGRNFVTAAEEVRNCSREYEQEVRNMRECIQEQERRVQSLEDTVAQLVKLLKDNNVAVTKLMRTADETKSFAERSSIRAFSKDLSEMKSDVTGIRNLEEEILKSEERNHMQLEDVLEEMSSQGVNFGELAAGWEKVSALAADYRQQFTKEGDDKS